MLSAVFGRQDCVGRPDDLAPADTIGGFVDHFTTHGFFSN
jgi:hypothetical protein